MNEHVTSPLIVAIVAGSVSGIIPAIAIVASMRANLLGLKEYVQELKNDLNNRIDHHEHFHH